MAKRQTITKEAIEKLRREMAISHGKSARYLFEDGLIYKVTPALRGSWYFQYRLPGRKSPSWFQIDRYGALPIPQARLRVKELQIEIAKGGDPARERAEGKQRTVAGLIDAFEAAKKAEGKKSAEQMAKTLRRHLFAAWGGEKTAVSVSKDDVTRLLDKLVAEKQSQNANKIRRLLHSMFAWALSRAYVRINPVADTDAPAPETTRTRTLTDSELVEVWIASEKLTPAWRAAIRLMIVTGQRRGEVGGMLEEELHLSSALWTIKPERSKNGNADITQLSPLAMDILSSVPRFADCSYVFSTDGKRPIGGWSKLKSALDKEILHARRTAAVKAGRDIGTVQPMPRWTLHDLRRTAATGLGRLGVEPHILERILHHSRKSLGLKGVYNMYEYHQQRKAGLEKWGAHVAALIAEPVATAAA